MKKAMLAVCMLFGFASAAMADVCETWVDKGNPVTMAACSYESGKSGYVKITNNGGSAAKLCWTVLLNSGEKRNACNLALGAGKTVNGVCVACGANNGGARLITLDSYKAE